jgi:hypothetical protein
VLLTIAYLAKIVEKRMMTDSAAGERFGSFGREKRTSAVGDWDYLQLSLHLLTILLCVGVLIAQWKRVPALYLPYLVVGVRFITKKTKKSIFC